MNTLQLLLQRYNHVTLDANQLAEILHLTPKTVTDQAAAGRLPIPTFKVGRQHLANIQDVANFLDDQGNL